MFTLYIHVGLVMLSFAYENIALKKPAYQQYPYTGPGPAKHLVEASNAVDGLKTNLSIWGGQCVLSDNDKQTATWWVNLTSILSIHHVRSYYRTEVYGWGCPTPGQNGPDCSTTCPDSNCRYCHNETGSCLRCKPGYHGHRCELECVNGQYGDGCENVCGQCADFSQCHHVNGVCLSGCDPGYTGKGCTQTCEPGTYGYKCGEKCGQCEDQSKCFHTNGLCLTGCRNGYHGDLCKTLESPKDLCDVSNGWQSSFYGVLMVLVLAVIWIGFLMVYIVILRKLKRRTSNNKIQMENSNSYITHIETDDHVIVSESYMELRNFRNDQDNYESIDFI
uniref:Multiple epidermal growth factor-like domains protein 10 isoform X2 n=1 Tax=Crassostrea virginica TaxID=6565 RepID=A0A8B8BP23_CRAVI|nr:multiple epidermal growth factor-like domains protein 10 isoform X2 [Crassostrea virginica]